MTGKWEGRCQGGGSDRSTGDPRAAKRAGRKGSEPVNISYDQGGKGALTTTPISLQELRRRIYQKAKAESTHQFWVIYPHYQDDNLMKNNARRKNEPHG